MAQYLIDTDVCISFLKGNFKLQDKLHEVGISNCFISEITIAELTYGAYASSKFEEHILEVKTIQLLFEVLPINLAFEQFSKEKVGLKKSGLLIPDFDLLIASTSIVHNLCLVTNNVKHFLRIDKLEIENWTKKEFNKHI